MITGMTASKIAVSLPAPLLGRVRNAVARGEAESVSAYVAAALEQKTKLDDLAVMLSALIEETGGAMTDAEREDADEKLDVHKSDRKRSA